MATADAHSDFHWPPYRTWHGVVLAIIAFILALTIFFVFIFQWNWLRGPVERIASRDTGRAVHIQGNLHVHLWSWHPTASVDGVSLSNPDWAKQGGNTAAVEHMDITARLWPLIFGRLDLVRLNLKNPTFDLFRNKDGRANWEFGTDAADSAKPMDIPPIQHFTIQNGKLTVNDASRHLTLTASISSHENAGGTQAGFLLDGNGTLNGKPFLLNITGGPLIHVDRNKPYAFNMRVTAGTTKLVANGAVLHPFNLGQLNAGMTVSGANLANLYYLTGLALPATPPYRLTADFTRDDRVYKFANLRGTIGRSDLKGSLGVDVTSGRPYLTADLTSHETYFTDLGPLVGSSAPVSAVRAAAVKAGVPTEAAVKEQQQDTDTTHLLPDTPLQVDRVRQMDADVTFHADRVISTDFPLRQLNVKVHLDHGVLDVNPISFALAYGKLAGSVKIDARTNVPAIDLDARLQDVKLQQFVATNPPSIEGTLEARAKLHGTGASIHKAASTSSGTFTAIVPKGTVRQKFAELLGINIDRAFLFAGNKDTNLRCVLADFKVQNGVMNARNIVFDSDVVKAGGFGTVNLNSETLNMQIAGAPKKFTLLRLRAPITVTGPIRNPNVSVKMSGAIAQIGAAVALGALLSPVAAILPFVDPGLAKDADCGAANATAQQHGAPHVKKAAVSPK
jgi:AsmA family protein